MLEDLQTLAYAAFEWSRAAWPILANPMTVAVVLVSVAWEWRDAHRARSIRIESREPWQQ